MHNKSALHAHVLAKHQAESAWCAVSGQTSDCIWVAGMVVVPFPEAVLAESALEGPEALQGAHLTACNKLFTDAHDRHIEVAGAAGKAAQ